MPVASFFTTPSGGCIGVWRMEESAAGLEALLEHPELYAAKTEGLKPESRRLKEILAVRCLLKTIVGEELPVAYDEAGHPSLPAGKGSVSISHTEGFAAVMYLPEAMTAGPEQRIGIDIERIGRRVGRVAERFLMPGELVLLARSEPEVCAAARQGLCGGELPEAADPLTLHLAWSAKETVYKVLGTSYYDLQHKTTLIAVDAETGRLSLKAEGLDLPLIADYRITSDYVLTYSAWRRE